MRAKIDKNAKNAKFSKKAITQRIQKMQKE